MAPGVLEETSPEIPIARRPWSTVLAFLLASATAASATGVADNAPGSAILFVGNSLTYVNDLPGMVRRVAEAAGGGLRVEMVAGPNLALIGLDSGLGWRHRNRQGHQLLPCVLGS